MWAMMRHHASLQHVASRHVSCWKRTAQMGRLGLWVALIAGAPLQGEAAVGTYRIDDDGPTGSGLTVSARALPEFRQAVADFHTFTDGLAVPFGSSNADEADEFRPVLAALDGLRGEIGTFRNALQSFAGILQTPASAPAGFGGLNPVTYTWRDSRGDHTVTAEVGDFKVPQVKRVGPKGMCLSCKKGVKMVDYQDDGSHAWVKVTRNDLPSAASAMRFWKWNPFGGRMSKMSRVSYSYDRVGLAGTH